ncbi:MAG: hypothetical protein ACFBSE_10270 [Prochloraceae cyanobacterium]
MRRKHDAIAELNASPETGVSSNDKPKQRSTKTVINPNNEVSKQ